MSTGMDFIDACSTSVHVLDGFDHVFYSVLALQHSQEDANEPGDQFVARVSKRARNRQLQNAVIILRNQGAFVSIDPTWESLWLFASSEESVKDSLGTKQGLSSDSYIVSPDTTLQGELNSGNAVRLHRLIRRSPVSRTGRFNASDMIKNLRQSENSPEQAYKLNSATFVQNGRLSANQDAQGPLQEPLYIATEPNDRNTATMFLSSVLFSIQFRLSKEHGILPLNASRLALRSSSIALHSIPWHDVSTTSSIVSCANMDLKLTSSGSIVATVSEPGYSSFRDMIDMQRDDTQQSDATTSGSTVLLAPTGQHATFVSHARFTTRTSSNQGPWSQLQRAEVSIWRTEVLDWLCLFGISLDISDQEGEWVRVKLWSSRHLSRTHDFPEPRGKLLTIEWPAGLCYSYAAQSYLQASRYVFGDTVVRNSKSCDGLEWFDSMEGHMHSSAMRSALDWLDEKDSREKELIARKAKREAAAEAERQNKDILRQKYQGPPSPAHNRTTSSGDSQAVNAIYPTPPDGVQSAISSVSPLEGATVLAPIDTDSKRPNVTFVTSPEQFSPYEPSQKPQSDTEVQSSDQAEKKQNILNQGDDEFLSGNGITEDDFNFFDDLEEAVDEPMIDVSQEGGSTLSFAEDSGLDGASIQDRTRIALDALENEGKSTGEFVERSVVPSTFSEDGIVRHEIPSVTPIQTDIPQGQGFSPPLSPVVVRQSMFSTLANHFENSNEASHDTDAMTGSRNLGYVSFNPTYGLSDSKYLSSGRFGLQTQDSRKLTTQSLLHHNFDLADSKVSSPRFTRNPMRRPSVFDLHKQEVKSVEVDASSDSSSESTEPQPPDEPVGKRPRMDIEPRVNHQLSTQEASDRDDLPMSINEESVRLSEFQNKAQTLLRSRFKQDDITPCMAQGASNHDIWSLPVEVVEQLLFVKISDHFRVASLAVSQASSFAYRDFECTTWGSKMSQSRDKSTLERLYRAVGCTMKSSSERDLLSFVTGGSKQLGSVDFTETEESDSAIDQNIHSANENVFRVPTPMIRAFKYDALFDLTPSSLAFWEVTGLGPVRGAKDVVSYCIYPSNDSLAEEVKTFMTTVSSSYVDCKLGQHAPGKFAEASEDGLISVKPSKPLDLPSAVRAIAQTCSRLGKYLAKDTLDEKSVVVYMVNPFSRLKSLQAMCTCFFALLQSYEKSCSPKSRSSSHRIVLQIIPISLITSQESPIFLTPGVATLLVRDIYDRCPPVNTSSVQGPGSSCIEISQPLPEQIPFEISAQQPRDLLYANSCLHVAYAWSMDERWITAVWSDNIGRFQTTTSYMMSGMQNFRAVAHEILETTLDFIRPKEITWRVFLASVGHLRSEEQDIWVGLLQASSITKWAKVILVSINPDPQLAVTPKPLGGTATSTSITAAATTTTTTTTTLPPIGTPLASVSTPVSTPQAQTTSPAANTTSPAAEHTATPSSSAAVAMSSAAPGASQTPVPAFDDANTRLVDITDEAWGLIFNDPHSVSDSLFEWQPAIASGMLMKRGGTDELDRPVTMEVHIMRLPDEPHSRAGNNSNIRKVVDGKEDEDETKEQDKQTADGTLKELLVMYRGLGLLARVRGKIDSVRSVLPLHVAIAKQGAEALTGWVGSRPGD